MEKSGKSYVTSARRMLHGGDYNPDQWLDVPHVLRQDIELMRLAHTNTYSIGIFAWSALEPEEGVYTFEWLDQIINDIHQNGGNVILATPSGARPAWLS
ncbi:beta-galactosidase, partial [Exiguobacterium sp.]|uniref:beta-galactosidase n=1 Tax=Exiguobacterium sp. TaxID=44751 RepID=UPI0028A01953